MAPRTTTYGKRRSSAKILSSQTQRNLVSDSYKSTKRVEKTTTKTSAPHADDIDELASFLLDDSNVESEEVEDQGSVMAIVNQKTEEVQPCGIVDSNGAIAILPAHPFPLSSHQLPGGISASSTPRKYSAKQRGGINKRRSMKRIRNESLNAHKEYGLVHPIADYLKKSPDISGRQITEHRPATTISSSQSSPILSYGRSMDSHLKPATARDTLTADKINEKVYAMLAATDALKPTAPQHAISLSSRKSRISSTKMLTKFSSVFDRLYPRNQLANPKDTQRLSKIPVTLSNPGSNAWISIPSSISTMEIRLNEGDNLNRSKVQRIVGGQLFRKPVPADGRSLRSGQSSDDPFCEESPGVTTLLVSPLPSAVSSEAPLTTAHEKIQNPFESESRFEESLQDGILTLSPMGSSTPRARPDRLCMSTSNDELSVEDDCSLDIQLGLAKVALKPGQVRWMMTPAPAKTAHIKRTERGTPRSPGRDGNEIIKFKPSVLVPGFQRIKKHPSPSKKELEDLEVNFRRYTRLKGIGAEAELDELARSYPSPVAMLSPRDQNRQIRRLSIGEVVGTVSGQPKLNKISTFSQRASTLPQCKFRERRYPNARVRSAYRPATCEGNEVDELQQPL